ncbi:Ionotropic receptor 652 [Blattella germanica]|nr:Ionotropic receptor 652 [Blattella germanica]
MMESASFTPISEVENMYLSQQYQHTVVCILRIVIRYFLPIRILIISLSLPVNPFSELMIAQLNEQVHCPLLIVISSEINSVSQDFGERMYPSHYIMIIESKTDFYRQMYLLLTQDKTLKFNPKARIIIMIVGEGNHELLQIIGKKLCKFKIHNVVMILPTSDDTLDFYTWLPYENLNQCGKFEGAVLIDQWSQEHEDFIFKTDLFPQKIPNDFQGCPIFLSNTSSDKHIHIKAYIEAMETFLLFPLFEKMNVKRINHAPRSVIDVVTGHTLQDFNSQIIDPVFSHPHMSTELKWFVPCSEPNMRQGHISKVFRNTLWFMISCVLLTMISVTFFIHRTVQQQESLSYSGVSSCFYNLWALLMRSAVTEMPRTYRLRLFLLLWIIYCFSICTVFEAHFTSYLVDPGLEKEISTVHEMMAKGFLPIFGKKEKGLWCEKNDYTKTVCNKPKVRICDEPNPCLMYVMRWKNVSVLTTTLEEEIISSSAGVSFRFCTLKNEVMQLNYALTIDQYSVYSEKIYDLSLLISEFGLVERMRRHFFRSLRLMMKEVKYTTIKQNVLSVVRRVHKMAASTDDIEYFALALPHLFEPVCILVIGYGLSILVALIELNQARILKILKKINKYIQK